MKHITIIGGGIIGLCTAYYLQKEGHQVTVIDQGDLSQGASFVNAGFISPSHFIPLTSPGIITKGVKMMFNPDSPFFIKPRLEREFLQWAWAFKKSATQAKVEKAIPVYKQLILYSLQLFSELKTEGVFDFHFEKKGLLVYYKTKKAGITEKNIAKRAIEEGLDVEMLSLTEAKKVEPHLSSDVSGVIHYKNDCHSTPTFFMKNLIRYLKDKGIQFFINEKVISFTKKNNTLNQIITQHQTIEADEVVIAVGSWTPDLVKKLGVNLLLQAGKGYRIDVSTPTGIQMPALLSEAKVAVTPMLSFTRFAGTMEINGLNHTISKNRVLAITNLAKDYYLDLHIPEKAINQASCGLRPVTPDGLPYIGKLSRYTNVTVATGHAMMGWSLGPATGKLVSQLLTGKNPEVPLDLFYPERRF